MRRAGRGLPLLVCQPLRPPSGDALEERESKPLTGRADRADRQSSGRPGRRRLELVGPLDHRGDVGPFPVRLDPANALVLPRSGRSAPVAADHEAAGDRPSARDSLQLLHPAHRLDLDSAGQEENALGGEDRGARPPGPLPAHLDRTLSEQRLHAGAGRVQDRVQGEPKQPAQGVGVGDRRLDPHRWRQPVERALDRLIVRQRNPMDTDP